MVFIQITDRLNVILGTIHTKRAASVSLLWHNFTNLHSRTEFDNDRRHERLLLRLWLSVPDGRPFVPTFRARGRAYDRVYEELRGTKAQPSNHPTTE